MKILKLINLVFSFSAQVTRVPFLPPDSSHHLASRKPYLATPFPVWARAPARVPEALITSPALWGVFGWIVCMCVFCVRVRLSREHARV